VPLHAAYLHGSAALGGFVPGKSDVDLLFVTEGELTDAERDAAVAVLRSLPGCPGSGIESSVLTREHARDPAAGGFELHVCTGPGEKVVDGRGHPGDGDLVLHAFVARAAGVTLHGPPAADVLGEPARAVVLDRLRAELVWALEHGSGPYAVLNACRALVWVREGRVVSKVEAGESGLAALPRHAATIAAALAAQVSPAASPSIDGAGRAFVDEVIGLVVESTGAGESRPQVN
jgi:hypothetical protein